MAGNRIERIAGVMNGTCNYILTRMENEGLSYDEVFEAAKALGYLEADPTLDVGGIDAGHKLALLAAIGFGTQVDFDNMVLEGIERITIEDIRHAADMGYRIKLLGVAQMTGRGLEQRMTPCLVPALSPLGQLENATNMVVLEGDEVGQIVLRGAGAGEGPTASAVMSDVLDIARGIRVPTFGAPATTLDKSTRLSPRRLRLIICACRFWTNPAPWRRSPPLWATRAFPSTGCANTAKTPTRRSHPCSSSPMPPRAASLDAALAGMKATSVLATDPVAIRIENV